MPKLLLNANLSHETASFLRGLGFDILCLLEEGLGAITDEEVVELAKKESRIIVTFDLDFGQLYHFREEGKIGVIILRLKNQTVETTNAVLGRFFEDFEGKEKQLRKGLVIIEEDKYRFYSAEKNDPTHQPTPKSDTTV